MITELAITHLGQRGEGVAAGEAGPVYVPYGLPDETVLAHVDHGLAHVVERLRSRPDRVPAVCPYFGTCGGCAVQELPPEPYAAWKRGLVVDVLRKAGVEAEVAALVPAHGRGRRRATLHARAAVSPNLLHPPPARVGFMRAHSHEIVDIAACPILAPGLRTAPEAARHLADLLQPLGKPLDIVATAVREGIDVDLRGLGPLDASWQRRLAEAADALDLARLSNHGEVVVEQRRPTLELGQAILGLPPGAFLQATVAGESALAALVRDGVGAARTIADLFCGVGTFALRLADGASVRAVDSAGPSLAALTRAARETPVLRAVTAEARDLNRRPLHPDELAFEAVVFDPPRAGADAQARALGASRVPTVVAVSCNPATFARDAALLIAGGYRLERVTPVDQFLYSPHVEVVGVFTRRKAKHPATRRLFG